MKTKEFPTKPLSAIARNASGLRISKLAAKALRQIVLDEVEKKAREAIELSRHANRNTVMGKDVDFVCGKD